MYISNADVLVDIVKLKVQYINGFAHTVIVKNYLVMMQK